VSIAAQTHPTLNPATRACVTECRLTLLTHRLRSSCTLGDWGPRRSGAPRRRPPARAAPRRARARAGAASRPAPPHRRRLPPPAPPRARRRAAARPAAPRRSGRRAGRRARRSAPPGPRAPRPRRSPAPPPVDPLADGGRATAGRGSGGKMRNARRRAQRRAAGRAACAGGRAGTSAKCQKAEVSGGPARMPLTGSFVLPSRPRWRPSRPSASRCASANESGGSGAHSARLRRLLPATSAARVACSRALPCSRACRERPSPPGPASMPAAAPRSCC